MKTVEPGQMVCIEFSTRGGRAVRLLGCLSEATEEHLLVEALEGSTLRPKAGESVSVSTLVGRTVQHASTTVLMSNDSRRLMVRRPLAMLDGNRRRHERMGMRVPVEWFEVEQGPTASRHGTTVNISVGGVLIETDGAEIAVGERLVLLLQLPNRRVPAVAEVRSWRAEGPGAKLGVQFIGLADLDRAAVAHLVA
jgi:hypothetical protein